MAEVRRFPAAHEEILQERRRLMLEQGLDEKQATAEALLFYDFPLLAYLKNPGYADVFPKKPRKGPPRGRATQKLPVKPAAPLWVNISDAAKKLGIGRNTIMSWCPKRGKNLVPLPAGGGLRHLALQRNPEGKVDLSALAHVVQHRQALPGPGRRLGGVGSREMVAAATRAHGSPAKAKDYSRVCKALSLLERVQDGGLLETARRRLGGFIQRRRRA